LKHANHPMIGSFDCRFRNNPPGPSLRLAILAAPFLMVVSSASGKTSPPLEQGVTNRLERLSIPFIANRGQTDPTVAFYAPTFAGTVYVTRNGQIVYSLRQPSSPSAGSWSSQARRIWSLTESPAGGRARRPIGADRASTGIGYFLGSDPARWRRGIPAFRSISLGEVWPRVSVELQVRGRNVEKRFTIEPEGDPSRIRLSLAGGTRLGIDSAGALVVQEGPGQVVFTPPQAFQIYRGLRHSVRVDYELRGSEYGFRLGDYNRALPLVIDPLLQSSYLGGADVDGALALAIHPITGDVYVAGFTLSTNFPGTSGGPQSSHGGSTDAFVARLNQTLTVLYQATYLGGSGIDEARAIAIHPATGEVYVAGLTGSSNFPGTSGGAQPVNGGGSDDAFVVRLNAALTALNQGTYVGGNDEDLGLALAIHPSGSVYLAGATFSSNFPGTTGGAQNVIGGSSDAFVALLNATLTTLSQSTYLGGSAGDDGSAIAIHPISGDVYIAGDSTSTNLPGTAGGAQSENAGNGDAFVARLNAALTVLRQATYLGGSGGDHSFALAIHPGSGSVYLTGYSDSTNFPGTSGGAQASNGGGFDAFVSRLNATLTTVAQSTYLGGSAYDQALSLAIHPTSGEVYVGGFTSSTNFPGTAGGFQPVIGSAPDAFVVRLNSALTGINQATYLGGSGGDRAAALAVHPTSGEVFAAGDTASGDFPGTTGGARSAYAGGGDAFVARLSADLGAPPTATPTATSTPIRTATPTPTPPPAVPVLSAGMLTLLALGTVAVALLLLSRPSGG
jgi:hypothetical protein